MVYSDQYKFIFLAIPKTGSRTIQNYLQDYGVRSKKGWSPNHDGYKQVMDRIGDGRSEYFKFAFFRNPWSLLISTFFYNKHIHNFPTNKKGVMEWLYYYKSGDPYAPYLFDERGNLVLNFIGKLERLDEDFRIVCEKLNIPVPEDLGHIGKQSNPSRLHYTEYYPPHLREKVASIFSRSLTILHYEFGDAQR